MRLKTFHEEGPGAIPAICPGNRKSWRSWLSRNHTRTDKVWLILYKKHMGCDLDYVGAVEEALCFGWIDSRPNRRDADTHYQFFSRRKSRSVWSASNKKRIEKLIAEGKMMPAGLEVIEAAKRNGSWTAIDSSEAMEMPMELEKALAKNKKARKHFEAFPPSARKAILQWIASAKTEATRIKRVTETVAKAELNIRANQWTPPDGKTK
jgi:uncharacterized protein YdeI (YjbR/CyaY-like superfamily)